MPERNVIPVRTASRGGGRPSPPAPRDELGDLVEAAIDATEAGAIALVVSPLGDSPKFHDALVRRYGAATLVGVFPKAVDAQGMAGVVTTDAVAFPVLTTVTDARPGGNCVRGDRVDVFEGLGLPRDAACYGCEDAEGCDYRGAKAAAEAADRQFMGVNRQKYVPAFRDKDLAVVYGDPAEVFRPTLVEALASDELPEELYRLDKLLCEAAEHAALPEDRRYIQELLHNVCMPFSEACRENPLPRSVCLEFEEWYVAPRGLNWCRAFPPAAANLGEGVEYDDFRIRVPRPDPKLLGLVVSLPAVDAASLTLWTVGGHAILTAPGRPRSPGCPVVVIAPGYDPEALGRLAGLPVRVVGQEQPVDQVLVRVTRHARTRTLASRLAREIARRAAAAAKRGASLDRVLVVAHRDAVVRLREALGQGVTVTAPESAGGAAADLLLVAGMPVADGHVAAHLARQDVVAAVGGPEWSAARRGLARWRVLDLAARTGAAEVVLLSDEPLGFPAGPGGKLDDKAVRVLRAMGATWAPVGTNTLDVDEGSPRGETPCETANRGRTPHGELPGLTVDELVAASGLQADTIRRRLAALVKDGLVTKSAGRPARYALAAAAWALPGGRTESQSDGDAGEPRGPPG